MPNVCTGEHYLAMIYDSPEPVFYVLQGNIFVSEKKKLAYLLSLLSQGKKMGTSANNHVSGVYVSAGTGQRKHQSSASLAFVRGIHQWPMNSPHKGPVTREMFLFDDVIMRFRPVRDANTCKSRLGDSHICQIDHQNCCGIQRKRV